MQLGIVGLGRMGVGIVRRIVKDGHTAVGFDLNTSATEALQEDGMVAAYSLKEFVAALEKPRTAWVMVPAGATGAVIDELATEMDPGDIIIDGGNGHYHQDISRASQLDAQGIHYLDIGTSGGVFGEKRGYCLMIGGDTEPVARLTPLFESIAPGFSAAQRSPSLHGTPSTAENGYLHCGPAGAGHFVKMIHNGIEYGAMAAFAEGLNIIYRANIGLEQADTTYSAEVTPIENPEHYRYEFDNTQISELWRRGSVITSWLLDLAASELHTSPTLDDFAGRVSDSGEGRWALAAAIDEGVPAPVLASALFSRFSSRGESEFADKVLSAMRRAMGGHDEIIQ